MLNKDRLAETPCNRNKGALEKIPEGRLSRKSVSLKDEIIVNRPHNKTRKIVKIGRKRSVEGKRYRRRPGFKSIQQIEERT